jgi:hypothetical protein
MIDILELHETYVQRIPGFERLAERVGCSGLLQKWLSGLTPLNIVPLVVTERSLDRRQTPPAFSLGNVNHGDDV